MKKRITLTIISLFLANISLAAPQCTQSAKTDCEAGCYIDPEQGCIPCKGEMYNNQTGQYLCLPCGSNSTSNDGKTGCTCNPGYHTTGQPQTHTENNSDACEANKYTITYNNNWWPPEFEFEEVKYNGNFTTKSSDTFKYPGYIFKNWTYNDLELRPNVTYQYTYTTGITLYAQWSECPAGYYCPDDAGQTKCPAGATSDAGADDITDCYMSGDITQICDQDDKCITLPTGTKIHAKIHANQ